MISTVSCRNYRSLREVTIPMGSITALVGPNGAGKTSILRAIDLVLGARWPSMASVQVPEDFTDFNATNEMSVTIGFEPALTHEDVLRKTHPIVGLTVKCRPYKRSGKWGAIGDLHMDFDPLDAKGNQPKVAVGSAPGGKPLHRPLTVSTSLREQARVLFIDHRRTLAQQLPSVRGSILGRLLETARRDFEADTQTGEVGREAFRRRYEAAMQALRTEPMKKVESTIAETAKRMIGFLGSRTVADVDIRFGFADPANPFNSLRLEYSEQGLTLPGQALGLGVQSAMVVGIFDAYRQLGATVGTIVIEEPEMFLHPQAQRYFYRLLSEIADAGNAQIIYSTHSSIFADAARFEAVRLVRRPVGDKTSVRYVYKAEDHKYLSERRNAQKLLTGFNAGRSEMFFAHKALLVEGPSDQLAVRLTAIRMGVDLDAEDLAVIECGSKSSMPFFAKVCLAFGIDFVVLHDEDLYPEQGNEESKAKIRAQNKEHQKSNSEIAALATGLGQRFVMEPSLEAVLGISRKATDKPRRVAEAIENLPDGSLPPALTQAVKALMS